MTPKPVPKTIEPLRVALQKLDHLAGADPCESAFANARHVLLLRLADAEADFAIIESLELGITEPQQAPEIIAWTSVLSLAEIEALEESSKQIPLYKLN